MKYRVPRLSETSISVRLAIAAGFLAGAVSYYVGLSGIAAGFLGFVVGIFAAVAKDV